MTHISTVPSQEVSASKPKRIDYDSLNTLDDDSVEEQIPSKEEWIPFFDRLGVLYYYNFKTAKSMRRNPILLFQEEQSDGGDDIISEEACDVMERISRYSGN